jgi:hypothetical protein
MSEFLQSTGPMLGGILVYRTGGVVFPSYITIIPSVSIMIPGGADPPGRGSAAVPALRFNGATGPLGQA